MTEKDLQIQDLKAENEKLKKQIEELVENELDPIEMCKVAIAIDKLKEYEKRGILFPCNVGDTIYAICVLGDFENVEECRVVNIQYHVSEVQSIFRCDVICKNFHKGYGLQFKKTKFGNDFGRIAFLTEQEAQSALEKMKGE